MPCNLNHSYVSFAVFTCMFRIDFDNHKVTAFSATSGPGGQRSLSTKMIHSMQTHYSLSPCTVATHLRLCFPFRNSRNQIPCQVPVASFPFVIGILTEEPINADLI